MGRAERGKAKFYELVVVLMLALAILTFGLAPLSNAAFPVGQVWVVAKSDWLYSSMLPQGFDYQPIASNHPRHWRWTLRIGTFVWGMWGERRQGPR